MKAISNEGNCKMKRSFFILFLLCMVATLICVFYNPKLIPLVFFGGPGIILLISPIEGLRAYRYLGGALLLISFWFLFIMFR